jgi:glycosyltransferase involved in cell wall biosynthesis
MRIYYHLHDYISYRRSGEENIRALRLYGHSVSSRPGDAARAEAAVVHCDPLRLAELFAIIPALREMRTIAFCVWENEILPHRFIESLRLVREIWTPSRFSRQSMLPHFSRVHVVPHVVRRRRASADDLAFAQGAIGGGGDVFRFFSIVDSVNPRKNLSGLLRAFAALRREARRKSILVIKQYRVALDYSTLPGVVSIEGDLTSGQMAALHMSCHAYVSAHHAEGWGLGLSEAMAYGRPVIATAYSGNMDYMDESNSLPVPYALAPVSEEMCRALPLFRRDMIWAEVDEAKMTAAMKRALEGRLPRDLPERAAAAAQRFSPEKVGGVMHELLTGEARQDRAPAAARR